MNGHEASESPPKVVADAEESAGGVRWSEGEEECSRLGSTAEIEALGDPGPSPLPWPSTPAQDDIADPLGGDAQAAQTDRNEEHALHAQTSPEGGSTSITTVAAGEEEEGWSDWE